jgi:aspartyl-tRNA(Asn)/glutamyl-tRNA(Gln) amidotransferase subunit C
MLTRKDVQDLAQLARIDLTPLEMDSIAPELDGILGYISEISEVVTEVKPGRVGAVRNVLRNDDQVNQGGEYTGTILANAPSTDNGFVKVKQIF